MTRGGSVCVDGRVTVCANVSARDPFRSQLDEDRSGVIAVMPTVPRGPRADDEACPSRGYAATPWGPAAVGRAMTRRRPLVAGVLLPLLTLGLAVPVWYARIHREMAAFDRRRDQAVVGPVLVLVLLGVTVVAPMLSFAATARRVAAVQRSAGLSPTCRPLPAALMCPLLGLGAVYLQRQLNRAVDAFDALPGDRVALRS